MGYGAEELAVDASRARSLGYGGIPAITIGGVTIGCM